MICFEPWRTDFWHGKKTIEEKLSAAMSFLNDPPFHECSMAFLGFTIRDIRVRLLVIDTHYLVAMEAEQVLGEAFGCCVTIAMPRDVDTLLKEGAFDVMLIDIDFVTEVLWGRIQRLREAGAGFVFTSVDSRHRSGVPGFQGIPVMLKPFDDERLVAVVQDVYAAAKRF
ncbi:hypothetical protein MUU53_05030 [Rhizobium lemnae]|uniref:Response regulatory domain-containing protein n=1 Tax=Rhizobium lemnae TaxID=1214924 RepID=A0ABV8E367_9HYPH|nr:hypothetical protein [Rhizobium lemnae]MCJ8507273.1 hypothetical protein [Rhizobium lemnae]